MVARKSRTQKPQDDAATSWAREVVAKKITAGKLMRGACKRHLADLADRDSPFTYDPAPGKKFAAFARLLRHYKGEWAGKPFELLPWQQFIVSVVLGWKRKADGLRRFRTAYVECPRKSGKSAFLSAFSLYMLGIDGEQGAECYCLATKKEQARIVFGDAIHMLPPSMRDTWFRERYAQLHFEKTNSKLEPLASDSKKLDGLNPHFACADELHEWPERALWDVIEDGMGARRQPLIFAITTAGSNRFSFCYTLRNSAVRLLEDAGAGRFKIDSFFAFIACADAGDLTKWRSPKVWAKANPSLGSAKRLDYMIQQVERIEAEPSKLNAFLNKQLSIWTDAAERWIAPEWWDGAAVPDLREALAGRRCWGGLDLARVHDLSALVLAFPPDALIGTPGFRVATAADAFAEKWKILAWHWCPEENIQTRVQRDRVPYDQWLAEDWIESTPGNTTDFAFVARRVTEICGAYQVADIGFDRMFAGQTVQQLQSEGIEMVEFGQGFLSMAGPTAELERLLRGAHIIHDGNPVLAWQAGNVVTETDAAGNLKPSKRKSVERIDGIVAAIMAIGRAQVTLTEPALTPMIAVI
jgi:phage terminase large subunit-like protein